jgi:hypothetical protein
MEHCGNTSAENLPCPAILLHFRGTSRWTVFQQAQLSLGSSWRRLHSTPILLTAFLLGLEPLGPDLVNSVPVGIARGQTATFDA